ncbi:MAG: TIGR02147 family protein [Polyangiales bacterium]
MTDSAAVNVFSFLDYREALRALYAHKKAHEYGFSHRAFSRRAGLKSTNFLKLVMDGERNLSPEAAQRFARALNLGAAEADYFCELVQYNQARSTRERATAYERLSKLKPLRAARELDASQNAYHARWYIPAVRELAARADFRDDPAWIARTLAPSITRAQAKKALETLLTLGMLVRQGERVVQADPELTTGPTPLGHHLADFHRAMIDRGREAMDLFPRDEREIGAVTMCIDDALLPALRERIQAFRRELLTFEHTGDRKRVVQVNFQLFPLTKKEMP